VSPSMSIHLHEHDPITEIPVRRSSDNAIPISFHAMAVILGVGIPAFSNSPAMEPTMVRYAARGK